jgi:hypothetical protein
VSDEEDDDGAFGRLMQELEREAARRRKDREWRAIREDWRAWREELREWLRALSFAWGAGGMAISREQHVPRSAR